MSNTKTNNGSWQKGCCNTCVHCEERVYARRRRFPDDTCVICKVSNKAVKPGDKCLSYKRRDDLPLGHLYDIFK